MSESIFKAAFLQNVEYERSILSHMLNKKEFIYFDSNVFSDLRSRNIYDSIVEYYNKTGNVTVSAIDVEREYLQGIIDMHTEIDSKYIIERLCNLSKVREFYREVISKSDKICNDIDNVGSYISSMQEILHFLTTDNTYTYNHTQTIDDIITQANISDKDIRGMSTGILAIDTATNGIKKRELTTIAGLHKGGKTKLAHSFISNLLDDGYGVLVLHLEDNVSATNRNILSHRSKIDSRILGTSRMTEANYNLLKEEADILKQQKLYVNSTTNWNISKLISEIRRVKILLNGLDIVLIDYFQKFLEREDYETASYVGKKLADIAKDEDIAMIVISQVSAGAEKYNTSSIQSQMRFGKALAEASNCILSLDDLDRRKKVDNFSFSTTKKIELEIIQRDGAQELIELSADLSTGTFWVEA